MGTSEPATDSAWETRLQHAIEARGLPVSVGDVLTVLADTVEPSSPLTAAEQSFLIEQSHLLPADLMSTGLTDVDVEIAANRAAAAQNAVRSALTVADVAHQLGRSVEDVLALAARGDLYAVVSPRSGEPAFPRWQFAGGCALPALAQIVEALPDDYLPADIEEFMTRPADSLGGRSPAVWLTTGGQPSAVVSLADERSWE